MEVGLVVVWWLVYALLLLLGLPLAARLLPDAPLRGAGLALPAALLALTLPTYWLGQVAYGFPTALAGALALVGVAALLGRRDGAALDRRTRRAYVEVLAVFTAAFLFLLAIRAVDAGAVPGGGEKFLDMGLLQSLLRSHVLPPGDFWFAGERVLYYYGGHLIAATLAELTGTPGRYAYNLALAGFYATAVTAAYGLAGSIAADRGWSRRLAGGLGAFAFGVASNLYVPAGLVATYLYRPWVAGLASATGNDPGSVLVTVDAFSYWDASRVVPGAITEFPFFAYLNGDLHAHMTGTTFLLLVVGVCYAYYRTPAANLRRRRLLAFGALPLAAGTLALVNTWSLPTALGLGWLALTFAPARPDSLVTGAVRDGGAGEGTAANGAPVRALLAEARRSVVAGALVVPVALLSVLVVAPFVPNVLLAGASQRSLATLPERTGLVALLVAQGGFILVFGWYLAGQAAERARPFTVAALVWVVLAAASVALDAVAVAVVAPLLVGAWYLHRRGDREVGFEALLVVAGAGLILLVEFVYLDDHAAPGRFNTVFKVYADAWALWAVAAGAALAGAVQRRADSLPDWRRAGRGVAVAGLVGALSLYALFSLLAHYEAYVGRWAADWPLVAGAALACALVVGTGWAPLTGRWRPVPDALRPVGDAVDRHPVLVVALVALLGLHAGLAVTGSATAAPDPTLDAIAFTHDYHPQEAAAIEWFDARDGRPTIVAAPGRDVYVWNNPVSSLTGVPAVVGWHHEALYRGGAAFDHRARDVDLLYTSDAATRAAVLKQYDVRYVYVGPTEREAYGSELDFDDEPGIDVAFRNRGVTVYVVDQSALAT